MKDRQHELNKIMQSVTEFFKHSNDLYIKDLKKYLTKRQLDIISLKLDGYRNVEIAEQLEVCPATITIEIYKIRTVLIDNGYKKLLRNF
jgi:DNA-binding NarL/FixJ family response regulator